MKKVVLDLDCLGDSASEEDLNRFVSFLRDLGYDVSVGLNVDTSSIDDSEWQLLMAQCFNS